MGKLDELDRKIELLLIPDDVLTAEGIEYRDELIEAIESMHDKVVKFRCEKTRRNMGDVDGYGTIL